MEQLHDLFETIAEQLGYETEPFRMYRPQGMNLEGYIRFIAASDAPFESHAEAMSYYVVRVARPLSPPPRFSILSQ